MPPEIFHLNGPFLIAVVDQIPLDAIEVYSKPVICCSIQLKPVNLNETPANKFRDSKQVISR